ncbi:RDD family protein [Microbulbifer sp. TYP-18]|uniref:RDD family protein n=1 Tax=Microbulbifer sp. TYP-18 TaxID=3230024 RepID=UPI0034C6B9E1
MADCPDFRKYNLQQLQEAYFGVNKKVYPERAQEILDRIEQRKLSHPEEIPIPKVGVAGRWERLLSAIIDGAIVSAAFLPIAIFLAPKYSESNPIIFSLFSILYVCLSFLVLNGSLLIDRGQTIGKKILGISIRDLQGNLPSFNTLIIFRPLLKVFFGMLLPLDLVNKLIIFRKDKRCLHDHILGTKVDYI